MSKEDEDKRMAEVLGAPVEAAPAADSGDMGFQTLIPPPASALSSVKAVSLKQLESMGTGMSRFSLSMQAIRNNLDIEREKHRARLEAVKIQGATFLRQYEAEMESMAWKFIEQTRLVLEKDLNDIGLERDRNKYEALLAAATEFERQREGLASKKLPEAVGKLLFEKLLAQLRDRCAEIENGVSRQALNPRSSPPPMPVQPPSPA